MGTRTIEVFADIWCPFAHVGIRRVIERRDAVGADIVLRVRAWPLELVNGAPMDAAFIGEEVVDIREQVAPDLFTGFREAAFPTTTLPALALVEAAHRVGPSAGEAMSLTIRDALFEHGRDIGDPAVLAELAAAAGVPVPDEADLEAVHASLAEGRERGVVGSPHFFTPDGAFFCPALDIARVDGHLRISPKAGMFDEFITVCFGDA
jgi:predicted DsbA family dithiol-disulfide isomerase